MTAPTAPYEVADLHRLAREALEEVGNDFDEVEARLTYLIRKERAKWFDVVIDYVVEDLVRQLRTEKRGEATGAKPGKDRALKSLKDEFEDTYKKFAAWPLSNGVPLSKATRGEVLAEAAFYRAQGKTMMTRADWFTAIARRMEANKAEVVSVALSGKDLYELHQEAETKWAE